VIFWHDFEPYKLINNGIGSNKLGYRNNILLSNYFIVQRFRGYVCAIRPGDCPTFYRCLLKKCFISQQFKNRSFFDILGEINLTTLAIVEDNVKDKPALYSIFITSLIFHIFHLNFFIVKHFG